jgi:hypothetical protein
MLNIKFYFLKHRSFFLAMVFESYTENWRFFVDFGLNLAIEILPRKETLDLWAL